MKALVTGASGFVGSHIVDRSLARGDQVRALVRASSDVTYLQSRGVELTVGDLRSSAALDEATRGVDVVYHSAARVTDFGSKRDFYDANVTATRALLEAAKRNRVSRFVFVSSPSVVTDDQDQVDIDESYPYPRTFVNLYSETKAVAEQNVLAENSARFITCAIRPRAVWGPRDRTGPLPRLLAKMAAGRLPNLSGGKRVYASLCYCESAAEACVLAARSDRVGGKAYFITDAEKTEIWTFATQLAELFSLPRITKTVHPMVLKALVGIVELLWRIPYLAAHRSPPISRYSVALLTRNGTYDTRAAQRDFGYRPLVDQATGLDQLKKWVDDNGGVATWLARASGV